MFKISIVDTPAQRRRVEERKLTDPCAAERRTT